MNKKNINKLRLLIFSFKDGFNNLRYGGIAGVISVITIAFTLLNIGLFFLLWGNISPVFQRWMKDLKIVCYLNDTVSEKTIRDLQEELKKTEYVKLVTFIDKSEAMKRFREILADDLSLIEGLDENPLPASFELVLKEGIPIDVIERITAQLKEKTEFEEVQSGKEWLNKLSSLFVLIKIIGILVGVVLIFISIFIISNTIRLTFLNRKEEVEIMRLVGANKWSIQMPFLIEGLLNGLLGGGISIIFLYVIYYLLKMRLTPYLLTLIGIIQISFVSIPFILMLLGIGMCVGGIGSIFSFRI